MLNHSISKVQNPLQHSKQYLLSPAENKFDLQMAYKVFFLSDSCRLDRVDKESN